MVKAQQPGDDVLNNAANDDVNNAADDDLNSASDNDMNNVAARIQCAETPSLQPLFDVTKKEFAIDVTQTEFAKTVVIFDDGSAETKDGEKCERKTFKFVYPYTTARTSMALHAHGPFKIWKAGG